MSYGRVFKKILFGLAYSAPVTLPQRVGAMVMCIVNLLSLAIIIGVVSNAWNEPWTTSGFTASAFGLGVAVPLTTMGIAHGSAAVIPRMFKRWKTKPSSVNDTILKVKSEDLRFFYQVIGWLSIIGFACLLMFILT